uniref:SP-RING-type domain-containing protein n=1 Tax=Oryza rufipogon TaxID=4529 RepID=A0A0E0Q7J2_ORYRU
MANRFYLWYQRNKMARISMMPLLVCVAVLVVELRRMTGSRIKITGQFKPCVHMGCFELEAFVELNQRSRWWQCPTCLKNYSLDNIIIDPS